MFIGVRYDRGRLRGCVKKTFAPAVGRYESIRRHNKIHAACNPRHISFRLDGANTITFVDGCEERQRFRIVALQHVIGSL